MVRKRIAIIPARGGSKRIPKKNIIEFCDKPMIAWTIEAALKSNLFDRILISTDDPETADVARKWGGEAPFLRESHFDDHSTVSEATLSAIIQAGRYWGEEYDTVVQLMANCPLRGASEIVHALSQFDRHNRQFQLSCFKYGWMNPWWAVHLDTQGHPQALFAEAFGKRSQDLPELFCPSGAIWIADTKSFLQAGTFYGPGHCFEPMNWRAAVDIDDWDDLVFANAILRLSEQYS